LSRDTTPYFKRHKPKHFFNFVKTNSMGESDRHHINERQYQQPKNRFLLGATDNALVALIAINVMVFIILMTIQVGMVVGSRSIDGFNATIVPWFELPASVAKLSTRPWVLLTYMFSHTGASLFTGFANMFWLWTFGYILQSYMGNNKLIPIYIYGGLLGALFFIVAHYVMPNLSPLRPAAGGLLGANAAVMAVAMATTTLVPNYRFFQQIRGGIPIWVLMLAYLLIDYAGVAGIGAAYSLAHLGGALAGFLFVYFLRKGKDGSTWMLKLYNSVVHAFDPKPKQKTSAENKVFYNTGNRPPFTKSSSITQKRVDELLDKINQKGYQFLTDEEKSFLKKAAESPDVE
jgi:membrane associated rhomboid family serine protease